LLVGIGFAWSMGAHYTGACMGMPVAAGAIDTRRALWTMAALAFLGALLASHRVELTIGRDLLRPLPLPTEVAVLVLATAFLLVTAFTALGIPTSTIQLLVAALVGGGLAAGRAVAWTVVRDLLAVWLAAPAVALPLGYAAASWLRPGPGGHPGWVAAFLVAAGAAASFTMGANDVANASGAFVLTHLFGVWAAAAVGGLGLALGALTWGRRLLHRVAFDIVQLGPDTAAAAEWAMATVVFVAALRGDFTSMNQALVAAMAGAGLARGRRTVAWPTVLGILRGWLLGPPTAFAVAWMAVHALA
jgi:PiT family inorganic phosphate transporter